MTSLQFQSFARRSRCIFSFGHRRSLINPHFAAVFLRNVFLFCFPFFFAFLLGFFLFFQLVNLSLTPRTSYQGERRGNKPVFSSSKQMPAESPAASRRRGKGCTQDGLESQMGGRRVGARHGGATTESFDARSGHDRRDMEGLQWPSASFC